MNEIGKIDKPDSALYRNKRKIYFARNLYLPRNATDKYISIYNRYWSEVEEHIANLETAGKISKIFCESIYMSGEEALNVLSNMNTQLEQIVRKKIDAGGEFLPLESRDIFSVYIDWYHCLMHVRTQKVYETVKKLLEETIGERFEHIKSVLMENITVGEAGLLIMRDEDREFLQLPDDTELFLVTPPAYDDLLNYIHDSNSGAEFWRT